MHRDLIEVKWLEIETAATKRHKFDGVIFSAMAQGKLATIIMEFAKSQCTSEKEAAHNNTCTNSHIAVAFREFVHVACGVSWIISTSLSDVKLCSFNLFNISSDGGLQMQNWLLGPQHALQLLSIARIFKNIAKLSASVWIPMAKILCICSVNDIPPSGLCLVGASANSLPDLFKLIIFFISFVSRNHRVDPTTVAANVGSWHEMHFGHRYSVLSKPQA
ncbi:hypothetical protein VTP01DRAFT_4034 [Rhizomucor pusillus]|uniref:uncharacterized protein n=1 Tax=Rhizomucor pusillus TaxID=4840 RepID=UPI0037449350